MNPSNTGIGRMTAGDGTVIGMTTTTVTADHRTSDLVTALRGALLPGGTDAAVAARVAAALADRPPAPPTAGLLHAEPGFSVIALAWQPGQRTRIHDHLSWCVVHVLHGEVLETRYRAGAGSLTTTSSDCRAVGTTSVLLPPDDIHRIQNDSPTDTAITLHVYGLDLREGGSTRRRYAD